VSGAVGAICRQRRVDSARLRRVDGGEGRYLNMSFSGWPEFTRRVRDISELFISVWGSYSDPDAM